MNASTTNARIVSGRALPYTEREQISGHFNLEGAHLCKPKLCMNQPEED